MTIDWDGLRAAAVAATRNSYVPYSRFPVGAAALTESGEIVTGCNVENASYGLSLCAECGLVSTHVARGGGRLVAVTAMHADGSVLMPCGRCRQLLYEFGGRELLVDSPEGPKPMSDILPLAFGPDDLDARA